SGQGTSPVLDPGHVAVCDLSRRVESHYIPDVELAATRAQAGGHPTQLGALWLGHARPEDSLGRLPVEPPWTGSGQQPAALDRAFNLVRQQATVLVTDLLGRPAQTHDHELTDRTAGANTQGRLGAAAPCSTRSRGRARAQGDRGGEQGKPAHGR